MKDRKVIKILREFTIKEQKSFLRFCQSPYFNTNTILVDLLGYIYRFAPKYSDSKFTTQNAFKQLYPTKKFTEQTMNRHLSQLFKLAEEFIIIHYDKENEIKRNINLLEYYKHHQLFPFFETSKKKLNTLNERYPYRDFDFFLNKYLIEYQSATILATEDNRTQDLNFDNTELALDLQYWIRKLSILCTNLNRKTYGSSATIDYSEVDQIISYLEHNELLEVPALKVWYAVLLLIHKSDNKTNYDRLKQLLENHHSNFKSEDIQSFYSFLINAVSNFYKSGVERYEEYFALFEVQILNHYIYLHGFIHPHILKNIVTVALRLKKYDWVESFLKENKNKIKSQESYFWNLANLNYEQGKYEKALDILLDNKYDDLFYQLGTKRMLSKIYYHLDYSELLFSFINTFRVFVSRKALNPIQKKRHQNFINFTLKLIKLVPGNTPELTQLLQKIETTEQTAEKNWLLEQTKIRMKQR